uniref:Uncharacterized protein n=1 Tax=Oryza meridionalis TaxID=40149 RepID=A0A0E0DTF4_9ORYZ
MGLLRLRYGPCKMTSPRPCSIVSARARSPSSPRIEASVEAAAAATATAEEESEEGIAEAAGSSPADGHVHPGPQLSALATRTLSPRPGESPFLISIQRRNLAAGNAAYGAAATAALTAGLASILYLNKNTYGQVSEAFAKKTRLLPRTCGVRRGDHEGQIRAPLRDVVFKKAALWTDKVINAFEPRRVPYGPNGLADMTDEEYERRDPHCGEFDWER